MDKWEQCDFDIDLESLKGRECYGGLDLSSTSDITAFVLVFHQEEKIKLYSTSFLLDSRG